MHPEVHFAASYADARGKFLAAALDAGARVRRRIHPERGPAGETLAVDVARLGPANARRVLVVVSATHGAEGFCGSGVQTSLLVERDAPRPHAPDTALVLIHAINPFGFAWLSRKFAGGLSWFQSGYVYFYAFVMLLGLAGFLAFAIAAWGG